MYKGTEGGKYKSSRAERPGENCIILTNLKEAHIWVGKVTMANAQTSLLLYPQFLFLIC
jgi:hypothetical protein